MNGLKKSDRLVVPEKPPNNVAQAAAEVVEGRGLGKGNVDRHDAYRTQGRGSAHSGLARVREAARKDRKARFTALLHHVTKERLQAAYESLHKHAATGVDGVSWKEYGANLESNLEDLHDRLHRGAYRAKPSRRVHIAKTDGRLRPLGIATLEDKIVQRAVVEVLNAIYETDFLGFSYGFRPGRSQHDALDALATAITTRKVNWVLDADIRGFFDAIDHGWLVQFVEHRIGDRRIVRLIQKWLKAGVIEQGRLTVQEEGTPQGATVSPLLANLYLHYVLDLWVERWRKRHADGVVVVVRYADDFIVGFEKKADAERFGRELRDRLASFSLELHPDKTRLIEFGRYAASRRQERQTGRPETFNFLGFTHVCGRARGGEFLLLRRTDRQRMTAKLGAVKTELMLRRHLPIGVQGRWLASVIRGHIGYYGVPTNSRLIGAFRREVVRLWRLALRHRGQRSRATWRRMSLLARRYLPPSRIQHPWPETRFDVRTRAKSRVR